MQANRGHLNPLKNSLPKCPTGIQGLDEVTQGGLPLGRPTLVCGSAGSGKTLFGLEFLLRGIIEYGEPGVLMTFEETSSELSANMRSLGFDLDELIQQNKLIIDFVRVEPHEIEETGDYDLEGLFVRLNHAIATLGAKRVVLDTIEALFAGLSNSSILRAELRRLFRWLKEKGVTAVITGERGEGALTRQGLEEYVSDCVIFLDHRVTEQISTRRLRIVKYRGSTHGTNEFPFLIDEDGISVIPITSAEMNHPANDERISSGIGALDEMLDGKGYFRGSSVLITGTAGTGKTSIAAQFAVATCGRGEKCLFVSFEEAPQQLIRNLHSIGLNLGQWMERDLLRIHSTRPTNSGLEMHLAELHRQILSFQPTVVIIDPISNFVSAGTMSEAGSMLVRLIDFLKSRGISSLFTNLTHGGVTPFQTDLGVSSIIDTWLLLRDVESAGEREAQIFVLKSRGMAHSKQVRRFQITNHGIELSIGDKLEPPAAKCKAK
ncbi:circadian clock protein KaiC [Schlesneria paludicola]|uniref:circadian clock protein KaiC n=1 Tax=Schlesneria paludicola TaxID=360056 RepID=UPI00029A2F29|nr:circadian clock protein KaiC [Schlesneria paludicola]